jgi:uncharacterized cupredoxin-like copper-binding protein
VQISRTLFLGVALAASLCSSSAFAHDEAHRATAFGRPGEARAVTRTVTVTLTDAMRFSPAALSVRRGETLRLHIVNTGKLPHEFMLGTQAEIDEHAEMMRRMPNMVHADASSVRVQAGKSADLLWQFSESGVFLYACLVPAHWEAGMQGRVTVIAAASSKQH